MSENRKLIDCAKDNLDPFLSMLKEFVELESPSHEDKVASDRCGQFLFDAFGALGFVMQKIPQKTCGDHLYGEFGTGKKGVLFVGHFDTVFPIGSVSSKMPVRMENGKFYGPGALDMKGGILVAYYAVKLLKEMNLLPEKKIGVFLNSDEESGSFLSSDAIVARAKEYECVFVMEPGGDAKGKIKMKRAGRATYEIVAHGVAAHSGNHPYRAKDPIHEIARQICRIKEWDRDMQDASLSPTWFGGGVYMTCMIPDTASVILDVRAKESALLDEIDKKIRALTPFVDGVTLEIRRGIDKPVMAGDPILFDIAKREGKAYGLELEGTYVGGGSDGNFVSAAGVPTLDGMGLTGDLLHNPGEYIYVDHIAPRLALIMTLLRIL